MQDIIGSVRRSLVFRSVSGDDGGGFGGFVDKIGSSIRKSRIGLFSKPQVPALPPVKKNEVLPIRWRKGELIGCGAFGRVYMGMNIDSGELLAVKQVLIAASSASKEKTQAHIRELEEEVKLLKNLSHPNIVRYLGTTREDDSLNILLEFVPGGSISSLLGKFGSFPESVIRMYTKQLLLGLEYLHKNGIMHRDIKGANILVDNKGCIKLADFGASKQVVELATMNGAKSMKGTPYWMAPEVILQTGHSFSADIWSVGCTVIEMATGKPPWSQQYQEVAALFHIGTTKSHPPIPDHLSSEAKDFLLKCLQKEPNLRRTASELLQHPFVTGEKEELHPIYCNSPMEPGNLTATAEVNLRNSRNSFLQMSNCTGLKDVGEMGSVRCSTVYPENVSVSGSYWRPGSYDDDMCQIDDKDDLCNGASVRFTSLCASTDLTKSFNPMCEPADDWLCKSDASPEIKTSLSSLNFRVSKEENEFAFLSGPSAAEDDDEVTESKIRAFLDEKAVDLKKMQTPLYEEFLNASSPCGIASGEKLLTLPPKSKSPKRLPSRRLSSVVDAFDTGSSGSHAKRILNASAMQNRTVQEIQPPQQDAMSPSMSSSEIKRKWKEELVEEIERTREVYRQTGVGGMSSSPNKHILTRQGERQKFTYTGK